ncbi:hypothetical protein AAG570_001653 [Ranatra chinensis]|uniref:Uncharacterized protein n=1 Tax=Ranatra chinensis TaxID=642074 RepID=A0ABD0YRR3_9HEMI
MASKRRNMFQKNKSQETTENENEMTFYNAILKPTWAYGVEVWGSAKKSNLDRIQAFQSKVLRTILDTPWYMSDRTTHHDLNIPTVQTDFTNFTQVWIIISTLL